MDPGSLIRERRLANGLTQKQLAIRAGSTQAAISRLERDEVSPTFETFERLLEVMGEEAEILVRHSEGDFDRARLAVIRERLAAAAADGSSPDQGERDIVGWIDERLPDSRSIDDVVYGR